MKIERAKKLIVKVRKNIKSAMKDAEDIMEKELLKIYTELVENK